MDQCGEQPAVPNVEVQPVLARRRRTGLYSEGLQRQEQDLLVCGVRAQLSPRQAGSYGLLPTEGMRQGDFSGLVNTPSGWLPQAVVDQFRGIAPNAVAASDSVIYQQYNVAA